MICNYCNYMNIWKLGTYIEIYCIPLYLNYFIIVYVNGWSILLFFFNCGNEITLFIRTVKTSISWVSDNIIFPRGFNKVYSSSLNYYLIIFINIYRILNLYIIVLKNNYKYDIIACCVSYDQRFHSFLILMFVIIFYTIW